MNEKMKTKKDSINPKQPIPTYKIWEIMKKENIGKMYRPIDSSEIFKVKDYSFSYVDVMEVLTDRRIEDVYALNYILETEFEEIK